MKRCIYVTRKAWNKEDQEQGKENGTMRITEREESEDTLGEAWMDEKEDSGRQLGTNGDVRKVR